MTDVVHMPSLVVPIPARENQRAKALRLVLEGRLRVRLVDPARRRAWVQVRGSSGKLYSVRYDGNEWRCPCQVRGVCSHLMAAWLVIAQDIDR